MYSKDSNSQGSALEHTESGTVWKEDGTVDGEEGKESEAVTRATRVQDVIDDPVFKDYGRLIFPVDRTISSSLTLEDVGDILIWYNCINPDKTVEIVNYLREQAAAGNQIFYDIYTEEEKAADPWKEDTGLFLFRGEPDGKAAICNAGGGFVYVGAMQDSFPHALELSKKGIQRICPHLSSGSADGV